METITICNSAFFTKEAERTKVELEKMGYKALMHVNRIILNGKEIDAEGYYRIRKAGWNKEIEDIKEKMIRDHIKKVMKSDAILVLNLDKDGKKNYIGGNVLIEMGLAFALNKKIFLINNIPDYLPYTEEIKGLKPIVLKKLDKIKGYI